ncbi:hypothetical protein A6R68_12724, partial [Neotoma lepida]
MLINSQLQQKASHSVPSTTVRVEFLDQIGALELKLQKLSAEERFK